MRERNCDSPANVAALGLIPARRLDVPKSEILSTPLYVFTSTLSPLMSRCTILQSCWNGDVNVYEPSVNQ